MKCCWSEGCSVQSEEGEKLKHMVGHQSMEALRVDEWTPPEEVLLTLLPLPLPLPILLLLLLLLLLPANVAAQPKRLGADHRGPAR